MADTHVARISMGCLRSQLLTRTGSPAVFFGGDAAMHGFGSRGRPLGRCWGMRCGGDVVRRHALPERYLVVPCSRCVSRCVGRGPPRALVRGSGGQRAGLLSAAQLLVAQSLCRKPFIAVPPLEALAVDGHGQHHCAREGRKPAPRTVSRAYVPLLAGTVGPRLSTATRRACRRRRACQWRRA